MNKTIILIGLCMLVLISGIPTTATISSIVIAQGVLLNSANEDTKVEQIIKNE